MTTFSLKSLSLALALAGCLSATAWAAPRYEFHSSVPKLEVTTPTSTPAPTPGPVLRGQLELTATSLSFADTTVGTGSATKSFQVLNSGTGPLALASLSVTGAFEATSNCGASLAPGGTCDVSVKFNPTAMGEASGAVLITGDADTRQVTLSGKGTLISIGTTPESVEFGSIRIGQTSEVMYATVVNTGSETVSISSSYVDAPFAINSNTCAGPLTAQASCKVGLRLTPNLVGQFSGNLYIMTSHGQRTIPVNGSGVASQVSYFNTNGTPLALMSFPDTAVGAETPAQTVVIKNTGNADLVFGSPGVTAPAPFTMVTNTCSGATVAPDDSCSVSLKFAPMGGLTYEGTGFDLNVASNGHQVKALPLSGKGLGEASQLPPGAQALMLLHMDGPNNGTSFVDSATGLTLTRYSAWTTTAKSKFGGASGAFVDAAAYLKTQGSISFGTEDFTIEAFVNPANHATSSLWRWIVGNSVPASWSGGWVLYMGANGRLSFYNNGAQLTSNLYASAGNWHHVAVTRQAGRLYFFLDGIKDSTSYDLSNAPVVNSNTRQLTVGGDGTLTTNGYLDDVRIVKGAALYTTNFTPLNAPLTSH